MIRILGVIARVVVALVRGACDDVLVLAGFKYAPPIGRPVWRRRLP